MRAEGQFVVSDFTPTSVAPALEVTTAVKVGLATMEKHYSGEVEGRSATLFTSAFDESAGLGTYLAMESFEGSLNGAVGTFNFAHSGTLTDTHRPNPSVVIVPSSGTGSLAGISGRGEITLDEDGTHRVWFAYEIS